MKSMLAVTVVLALCGAAVADNYAVLVAGSNTYGNYRHQADVCHAYQILHKQGIPDSNIVTFMYDDIAQNPSNPKKGSIINKPNGPNVYDGVLKDYTGKDVTPENFLSVIKGDAAAMKGIGSGKVLGSKADDKVFIYFSDHGGPGLIAFPSTYLYAKDLIPALQYMHDNKMYSELVFYLEACESGSMFAGLLPDNINIYAVSAANPSQSSYAFYYDSTLRTYLGDEFSIRWMEDSDVADLTKETIADQYKTVKDQTKESHVCEYGDKTISSEILANFQAASKTSSSYWSNMLRRQAAGTNQDGASVSSRDVELSILEHRLLESKTAGEESSVEAEIAVVKAKRHQADTRFESVVSTLMPATTLTAIMAPAHVANDDDGCKSTQVLGNQDCLESAIMFYESECGRFDDYSLKYMKVLDRMCATTVHPIALYHHAKAMCA